MGREAECICECNGSFARVRALLEPPHLVLRGEIRRRLPLSKLTGLHADGQNLRFACENESFVLALGSAPASKWVAALTASPPTLAKKLGITPDSVVRVIGTADDEALRQALSSARAIAARNPDLIVACITTPGELAAALRIAAKQLAARIPVWFVYPKGRGHALSEAEVRSTTLAAGIVDTKVATVSAALTALRFVKRRDG